MDAPRMHPISEFRRSFRHPKEKRCAWTCIHLCHPIFAVRQNGCTAQSPISPTLVKLLRFGGQVCPWRDDSWSFYDLHLGYISPLWLTTRSRLPIRPRFTYGPVWMPWAVSLPFLTSISKHPYVVLPWIGTGGWLQEVLGGRWLCRQLSRGKASGDWCQICQKHSESHRCHDFLSPMLAGKFSATDTLAVAMKRSSQQCTLHCFTSKFSQSSILVNSAKLLDGRLTCWTQCTEGHLIVICWTLALYKLAGKYQGYNLLRVWV